VMDQIRGVVAVLVPPDDAEYLVQVISYIEAANKRQGGVQLSARLVSIRHRLAAAVRDVTHADASTEVPAAHQLIALTSEACIGTAEAAELLGITVDAVRWHYRNGNLEGRKMGRQVVITAESIDALKARRAENQNRSA
jgi:excisionase family DNA binding protein